MPWKGNQQTYYCHSPVLEPESWGPLWLWWWRCGTGVLHFTHFLVPFSAWLNPWDPFGFPARNDQKHIETPCWPLRRSRGSKPNDFKVCEKNAAVEWSICIHLYTYLTDSDFMNWKSVLQKGKTLSSYPQAKSVWLGSLSLIPLFPFCSDILEDFGLPLVETTEITRSPILPGDLSVAGSARSLVIGRSHTAPLLTANRWWKLWLAKMDRFSVLKPKPDSQFWTWTVLDVLDMVGPCCPIEFNTQLICLKVRSSKAHETL